MAEPQSSPSIKFCKSCQTEKPQSEFYRLPHTSDGLNWRCIPCQNAYNKEYNYRRALARCDKAIVETLRLAPAEEIPRFARKIMPMENGCWAWHGNIHPETRYGRFWFGRHLDRLAHRVAYEWSIGPIPEGMVIDHLCRNRQCVNPSHLEVVTNVENVMRGYSIWAINARKTHCKRGHEFTPENTIERNGTRACRTCRTLLKRARRALGQARLVRSRNT